MFHLVSNFAETIRPSRWHWIGTILACLALSGCANCDLRGEPFPDESLFPWSGQVRQRGEQKEFFGFSNKARQIEQDLGVR